MRELVADASRPGIRLQRKLFAGQVLQQLEINPVVQQPCVG
jgi:hypothetical protein